MIGGCPHCAFPLSEDDSAPLSGSCPSCGAAIGERSGDRARGQSSDGVPTLQAGEHSIGRFELIERVGAGAFGTVWKARDSKLARLVALKILHPGRIGYASDRERFYREAQTAAQLRHPGIVPVHEVAEFNGMPVIVSGFVQGTTLGELRSTRPFTPRESAAVALQIAEALEYAHSMGVVHRDIKPGNVMIESLEGREKDPAGVDAAPPPPSLDAAPFQAGPRVQVLDFGLALRDDVEATLTTDGQLIGTPAYMSPEQASGRAHQADKRSDIYSLGVVLYELICGRLPFRGREPVVLEQVMNHEPQSPRKIDPAIPRDLESICLKAMAKAPRSRYQSARELADDLRRFLGGTPVVARPVGSIERTVRWCRRRPMLAGLMATVGCLVVAVAVVSTWSSILLDRERRAALDSLWHAYLSQARSLRLSAQPGHRFDDLDVLEKAAAIRRAPEVRDEALAALPLVDARVERSWKARAAGAGQHEGIAFDERFDRCACEDADGVISILRLADSTVTARFPACPGAGSQIRMSAGGRFLSIGNSGSESFRVIDVDEQHVAIDGGKRAGTRDYVLALDDHQALIGNPDGSLATFDLPSGQRIRRLPLGAPPSSAQIHPSGESVAVQLTDPAGPIILLDLDTGKTRPVLPPRSGQPLAFSPDGTRLAVAVEMNVDIVDLSTMEKVHLVGHQSIVQEAAFHPSGELLATRAWDSTTRLWDSQSGKELLSLPGHFIRFDADGERLAFALNADAGWWRIASGRECRTFYDPSEEGQGPWSIAGHVSGRILVTTHDDGTRLWESATGAIIARLPTGWSRHAVFDSLGVELFTAGEHGIQAWPIDFDPATGRMGVGAPRTLVAPATIGGRTSVRFSASGRWGVAPLQRGRILVIDLAHPADTLSLGPHAGVSRVTISPNGRWVVSGAQFAPDIKIWDVRKRALAQRIPSSEDGGGTFSADGRWLMTGSRGEPGTVRSVPGWDVRFPFPQPLAPLGISDDGGTLVVAESPATFHILSTADGRELMRLTAPSSYPVSSICFAPDAAWFAISCYNSHRVQVWDLALLRGEIAALGLDTDPPVDAAALPDARSREPRIVCTGVGEAVASTR